MKSALKLLLFVSTYNIVLSQNTSTNFLIKTELEIVSRLESTHFNGEDAGLHSAPWMVSIQLDILIGENKKLSHRCSGTILNSFSIITSDQCVTNLPKFTQLIIIAGIFNLDDITNTEPSKYIQFRYPTQIIRHIDNIKAEHYLNDIAIIKLKIPLELNNRVQPINLLTLNQGNYIPKIGFQFGWSINKKAAYFSDLQVNIKNLTSAFKCERIRGRLNSHDICVETPVCNTADHGSPLIIFDDSSIARLWGIWSFDYCEDSAVSIFTSISNFNNWIRQSM